jgi:serine O-acetyltransferase
VNSEHRTERLRQIARAVADTYRDVGGINRIGEKNLPSQPEIIELLRCLLRVVFPGYYGDPVARDSDLELWVAAHLDGISLRLADVIDKALNFCYRRPCHCSKLWLPEPSETNGGLADFVPIARSLAVDYLSELPEIRSMLRGDVQAAYEGDPAAVNQDEIILCYPGTFAIAVHRLAHPLYRQGVPLIPRIMSEWAHQQTGVDIHPGAQIGPRFFIDHGTGVVIGETTEIGADVKIYQGVTLGALSFPRNPDGSLVKGGKRHPTIGDRVTIYANATILGGDTVIGSDAVIGGGTWITASIDSGARITLAV